MPATSGTRRGTGPGIGGAAKGASVFGSTGAHADRGDTAEAWDADTVPAGGRADNGDADEQAYRQQKHREHRTRAERREREEEVTKWRRAAEKVLISAMIQSTKMVDKIAAAGTLARILPPETRPVDGDVPEDSAERVRQLEALLFDIARNGRPEDAVRISAANAALDRIKGKPMQSVISAQVDDVGSLSDEQIRAELSRLSGTTDDTAAGDGTPPLPD